jgi:hypothetical protein
MFGPEVLLSSGSVHSFCVQLIKMRQYLVRKHIGRSDVKMIESLGKLIRNLEVNPTRNSKQQAKFFLHNAAIIELLLPGKGCKSYEHWKNRYMELQEESLKIVNTFFYE